MDRQQAKTDDFVHLARLALAGRRQDVESHLRRLVGRYRAERPDTADALATLLRDAPRPAAPLRNDAVAALPVDADSRLHLLRYEPAPRVDVEPIWTPEVQAALEQLVAERRRRDALARQGLAPTRTALFSGAPGVGKSMAARWLARELGRPLLVLDLAAVMSSFLGRTGTNLRHVMDYAKGLECVLLIDEIDALAKRRDDAHEVGELKRLVTVLLQEVDDWPAHGLLVAATNHAGLLDPAAWRRFEVVVPFPMPDDGQVRRAVCAFAGPPAGPPADASADPHADARADAAGPTDRPAARRRVPGLRGVPPARETPAAPPATGADAGTSRVAPAVAEALAVALRGLSFSEIERELTRARRAAVVHGPSFEHHAELLVRERAASLPRAERLRVAQLLVTAGLSQRKAREYTGVSRDTIRKARPASGPAAGPAAKPTVPTRARAGANAGANGGANAGRKPGAKPPARPAAGRRAGRDH